MDREICGKVLKRLMRKRSRLANTVYYMRVIRKKFIYIKREEEFHLSSSIIFPFSDTVFIKTRPALLLSRFVSKHA